MTTEPLTIWRSRWGKAKKIAIVRVDNIGDFVLWLPTAHALRTLYPDHYLTLYANNAWADFAAFFDIWNEVVPIDLIKLHKNLPYRYKTLRAISGQKFETAIQPTYSRELLTGDSLIRATGAVHRIGSQGDLSNATPMARRIADRWYTRLIPADPTPMTELERNAEFIEGLGAAHFKSDLPHIPKLLDLPSTLSQPRPYFIIFPGASWSGRQWPANQFAALIREVASATGRAPVLCGGPADRAICSAIQAMSNVAVTHLAGQTSLAELTELIREADFLIGNETSAIHLAAAVKTPSVCLLGGGHYGRFMPYPACMSDQAETPVAVNFPMPCYGCNWQCSQAHQPGEAVPCIANISVNAVLASPVIQHFTSCKIMREAE
ncbi:MAG: glycosyltransferase family 9 protein [Pseudomonadota bacterium]